MRQQETLIWARLVMGRASLYSDLVQIGLFLAGVSVSTGLVFLGLEFSSIPHPYPQRLILGYKHKEGWVGWVSEHMREKECLHFSGVYHLFRFLFNLCLKYRCRAPISWYFWVFLGNSTNKSICFLFVLSFVIRCFYIFSNILVLIVSVALKLSTYYVHFFSAKYHSCEFIVILVQGDEFYFKSFVLR